MKREKQESLFNRCKSETNLKLQLCFCFCITSFSHVHLISAWDKPTEVHKIVSQLFSPFLLSFPFFFFFNPPSVSPNNPFEFLCPGPFIPKSTLTQLKIHFVWPKSEGVCAMGLLHSALKLVLWRRMGYYYLPATHPAIKTSGATSPQRSAAALPPFLSLSSSSYMSQTLNSTLATLLHRQTQESHSALLCCAAFRFPPLDIPLWVFLFFIFVNGHPWPLWGACEWTDCLADWLTDWQRERQLCFN